MRDHGQASPSQAPIVRTASAKSIRDELFALLAVSVPELDARSDELACSLVRAAAHLAETVAVRLNGVPDRDLLELLEMLGRRREPARSARAPVRFDIEEGSPAFTLPAGTPLLVPASESRSEVQFETIEPLRVVPARVDMMVFVDPTRDTVFSAHVDPQTGHVGLGLDEPCEGPAHLLLVGHEELLRVGRGGRVTFEFAGEPPVEASVMDGEPMAWGPRILPRGTAQVAHVEVQRPVPMTNQHGIESRWIACGWLGLPGESGGRIPKLLRAEVSARGACPSIVSSAGVRAELDAHGRLHFPAPLDSVDAIHICADEVLGKGGAAGAEATIHIGDAPTHHVRRHLITGPAESDHELQGDGRKRPPMPKAGVRQVRAAQYATWETSKGAVADPVEIDAVQSHGKKGDWHLALKESLPTVEPRPAQAVIHRVRRSTLGQSDGESELKIFSRWCFPQPSDFVRTTGGASSGQALRVLAGAPWTLLEGSLVALALLAGWGLGVWALCCPPRALWVLPSVVLVSAGTLALYRAAWLSAPRRAVRDLLVATIAGPPLGWSAVLLWQDEASLQSWVPYVAVVLLLMFAFYAWLARELPDGAWLFLGSSAVVIALLLCADQGRGTLISSLNDVGSALGVPDALQGRTQARLVFAAGVLVLLVLASSLLCDWWWPCRVRLSGPFRSRLDDKTPIQLLAGHAVALSPAVAIRMTQDLPQETKVLEFMRAGGGMRHVQACEYHPATRIAVLTDVDGESGASFDLEVAPVVLPPSRRDAAGAGPEMWCWEYWDGEGWNALLHDTAQSVRPLVGHNPRIRQSLSFSVPSDAAAAEIDGVVGRWVRLRPVSGDVRGGETVSVRTRQSGEFATYDVDRAGGAGSIQSLYVAMDYKGRLPLADLTLLRADPTRAERIEPHDHVIHVPSGGLGSVYVRLSGTVGGEGLGMYLGVPRSEAHERFWRERAAPVSWHIRRRELDGTDSHGEGADVWEPLRVREDGTGGLLMPGILRFDLPPMSGPVWLRCDRGTQENSHAPESLDAWDRAVGPCTPRAVVSSTKARVDCAHLNVASAIEARTITGERLGSSDARPNQEFWLASVPVLRETPPASGFRDAARGQEIQVRELLSEEERRNIERLHGPGAVRSAVPDRGWWVRWKEERRGLRDAGPMDRVYSMDWSTGRLSFGDGVNGRIPPAGRDNVRACRYQAGGGVHGNLPRGAISRFLGATAGIRRVASVAEASGGAGTSSARDFVSLSASRLRHGERIVSCHDLERIAWNASRRVGRVACLRTAGPVEPTFVVYVVPNVSDPDIQQPYAHRELRGQVEEHVDKAAPPYLVGTRARVAKRVVEVKPARYKPLYVTVRLVEEAGAAEEAERVSLRRKLKTAMHPSMSPLELSIGAAPEPAEVLALLDDHAAALVDEIELRGKVPSDHFACCGSVVLECRGELQ